MMTNPYQPPKIPDETSAHRIGPLPYRRFLAAAVLLFVMGLASWTQGMTTVTAFLFGLAAVAIVIDVWQAAA